MTAIIAKYFKSNVVTVPYICLRGDVSRQMTIHLSSMLNKVPKNTQQLAIVVNSNKGSFAQAHIINTKISQFALSRKIAVYTFVQDFATNAGYYLCVNGSKIFADKTSIIGGVQVNMSKFNLGDMIKHVTYSTQPSAQSQMNHTQQMNPQKKKEMEGIFAQFSQMANSNIKQTRKIQDKPDIDLNQFFTGQQAKSAGLIDQFGRMFEAIPRLVPNSSLKKLAQSPFQRLRNDLRKLNFW